MSENLNHPEKEVEEATPIEEVEAEAVEEVEEAPLTEEVEETIVEAVAEETPTEDITEENQPANEDVKELSFKDKLHQTVPPVIGWCIFAGALALATGIALLILL